MTDQRHEAPSVADDTVSRTYREVAGERVPEHLDRAILAGAARAARPRYARSRAWTRPVAWAAIVALTVGIVLELTRVPDPEEVPFDLRAPADGDGGSDAPAGPAAPAAQEEEPAPVGAGRSGDVMPKTPEKASLMQKTSAPHAAEADQAGLERQDDGPAAAVEPAAPAQTGRYQPGGLAGTAEDCPDAVRRDPYEWLECIAKLEDAGFGVQAAEQKRLLREAFPAFDMP